MASPPIPRSGCSDETSLKQARLQMTLIMGERVAVKTIDDARLRRIRTPLWALMGAMILVLGIACVNLASVHLARGHGPSSNWRHGAPWAPAGGRSSGSR